MPKRRRKMTIKEESPEEVSEEEEQQQMEVDGDEKEVESDSNKGGTGVEVDLSARNELLRLLEESSLKLVRNLVARSREICKYLVIPSNIEISKQLSEQVQKVCRKHSTSAEKVEKFFSKVFPGEEGGSEGKVACESEVFKTLLKYGMNSGTKAESGPNIIGMLQAIFSVGAPYGRVLNPTLGIQMIVSHSTAADIFLESHHRALSKKPGIKEPQEAEEKYSEIKTQLLKLWKYLVISFTKVSKKTGTTNDKTILENSVPYLFQMYSATMSEADQEIYQILQEYTGKRLQIQVENLPLFGPKSWEEKSANPKVANPLFAHSSRANTILSLMNERQAYQTAMEYSESSSGSVNGNHYDFRFLLPLLCHALDAKNICDAVRVINNGWIYLIVRGLSFEDTVLRSLSFLAYRLLIQNFQLPKKGFKMQDIKVWLHFLLSVRKGMQLSGRCKISNLLSVWMVSAWECIRQPAHPLYPRLTTLLFAKPVIDLTLLPDFLPFYNATDGNRATRDWMINILSHGLQNKEDWQVAQRLPTINSLCASFLVEKTIVQRQILKILKNGACLPEIAQEMVDKHSLLLWIVNISPTGKHAFGRELHDLFKTLKLNCPQNDCRQMLFDYVADVHCWTDEESRLLTNIAID